MHKENIFIFKAVGDPTVKIFASRDIDSYIQDREAFAVQVLDIMEIYYQDNICYCLFTIKSVSELFYYV